MNSTLRFRSRKKFFHSRVKKATPTTHQRRYYSDGGGTARAGPPARHRQYIICDLKKIKTITHQ